METIYSFLTPVSKTRVTHDSVVTRRVVAVLRDGTRQLCGKRVDFSYRDVSHYIVRTTIRDTEGVADQYLKLVVMDGPDRSVHPKDQQIH